MTGANLVWSALIAALLGLAAIGPACAATPNVVVFLADDMGWGDLHANNPASPIPTPNLDRLAREGMRFTNAHTSAAKCAPSRYSILTGNYQWRGRWKWGAWQYYWESQIRPGQLTIGDMLRQVGYRTAYVGKLHMGGDFFATGSNTVTRSSATVDFSRGFGNGPLAHGFGYSFTILEGIRDEPYAYFENDRLVGDATQMQLWPAGNHGDSTIVVTGRGMPYWNSSAVGPDLMRKAIGFIDQHLQGPDAARPFLLFYAAQSAHEPYTPPAKFDGTPIRGATGLCPRQDMIYEVDVALGRLHDALRTRGLLENTLIYFTSDNGGLDHCGLDSSGPGLSGYKGQVLEGGHRVPLIVKWGDAGNFTIPPATVRRQLVGAYDLAASLAGIVGVDLDPAQARDSFDLSPVWLGRRGDSPPVRGHLMAESRDLDLVTRIRPTFASIEGPWKLVAQENGTGFTVLRLGNLRNDPKEESDLKDDPAQAKRVKGMLARFIRRHAAERTAP